MVWILTSCEIVWRKKLNDRCREVLINRRVHHQCLLLLARLDLFVQCQTVKLQIRMFPLTFWLFNYPSTNNSDVNHFLLSVLNSSSRFNHLQEEKMTCFQRNPRVASSTLFLFLNFLLLFETSPNHPYVCLMSSRMGPGCHSEFRKAGNDSTVASTEHDCFFFN